MTKEQRPSLWQYVISVVGSACGIQSSATRERDFTSGNPLAYVIGGIVFTALFITTLLVIVNLVLP